MRLTLLLLILFLLPRAHAINYKVLPLWNNTAGANVDAIDLGDFNGDNLQDVVAGTNANANNVMSFVGYNGSMLWSYSTGDKISPIYGVRAGNLTGNGYYDVATISKRGAGNEIQTIYGNNGTLYWGYDIGNNDGLVLAVVDLNGDGIDDVIEGGKDRFIRAFYGNGTIFWSYTLTNNRDPKAIDTGYVDNDSTPDVVVVTKAGDPEIYVLSGNGTPLWTANEPTRDMEVVKIADLNNDGVNEIVVGGKAPGTNLFVYYANGTLWWSYTHANDIKTLAIGDINNDSYAEIVFGDNAAGITVLSYNGTSLFQFTTTGKVDRALTLIDIDNDGILDIVAGETNPDVAHAVNGSGVEIWNYTLADDVKSGTAGRLTQIPVKDAVFGLRARGAYDLIVLHPVVNFTATLYNTSPTHIIAGQSVNYTINISNVGGVYDNYTLIIESNTSVPEWSNWTNNRTYVYRIAWNGNASVGLSIDVPCSASGVYYFNITVISQTNTSVNLTLTGNFSLIAPFSHIEIIHPTNGSIISGIQSINASITSLYNVTSVYAIVSNGYISRNYTLSLYQGNNTNGNWSNTSFNTTQFKDGIYNITINASSGCAYNDTEYVSVIIDNYYPNVSFVAPTPSNGSVTDTTYLFVNTSISEQVTLCYLEWRNSSGSYNLTMSISMLYNCHYNYTFNLSSAYAGNYSFRVWVRDTAGRWYSSELRYIIVKGRLLLVSYSSLIPANISAGTYNVTVLRFAIRAVGEAANISQLTIEKTGTYPYTKVNASLYWDRNNDTNTSYNTPPQADDQLLSGPIAFGSNNRVTFSGSPLITIEAGRTEVLVIYYDVL